LERRGREQKTELYVRVKEGDGKRTREGEKERLGRKGIAKRGNLTALEM